MSSNIEQIIERHVPAQYRGRHEVAMVVNDLNAERARAGTVIRRAARDAGLDAGQVDRVLIEAGLVDAPEEGPVGDPAPTPSAEAPATTLEGRVVRLEEFASRHGFRPV